VDPAWWVGMILTFGAIVIGGLFASRSDWLAELRASRSDDLAETNIDANERTAQAVERLSITF